MGDIVDERSVVRNEDDGCTAACKELFEPAYRLNVQVVCRFVEEQHIVSCQQQFCQFYTHTPTAGEFACGAFEIAAFETKTLQRALYFGTIVLCSHKFQTFAFA